MKYFRKHYLTYIPRKHCQETKSVETVSMKSFIYERVMRKPAFYIYAKKQAQISCAVTLQLVSTYGFATYIVQSFSFYTSEFSSLYPSFVAVQLGFVSHLVGDPDRFSRNVAHMTKGVFKHCIISQNPLRYP